MKKLLIILSILFCTTTAGYTAEKNIFPDLKLQTLNNKKINLSSLINKQDLILLNFFTTWCGYCQQEIPDFIKLTKTYNPKKIIIIGIDYNEDLALVKKMVDEAKINYPVCQVTEGELIDKFTLSGFPTTIIINRKREIIDKIIGYRDYNFYKKYFNSASK